MQLQLSVADRLFRYFAIGQNPYLKPGCCLDIPVEGVGEF
jgi:hypothetical protein